MHRMIMPSQQVLRFEKATTIQGFIIDALFSFRVLAQNSVSFVL